MESGFSRKLVIDLECGQFLPTNKREHLPRMMSAGTHVSWKTASHPACFVGVLSIEVREREVRMSSPGAISPRMDVSQEYHQNQIVVSVSIEPMSETPVSRFQMT